MPILTSPNNHCTKLALCRDDESSPDSIVNTIESGFGVSIGGNAEVLELDARTIDKQFSSLGKDTQLVAVICSSAAKSRCQLHHVVAHASEFGWRFVGHVIAIGTIRSSCVAPHRDVLVFRKVTI